MLGLIGFVLISYGSAVISIALSSKHGIPFSDAALPYLLLMPEIINSALPIAGLVSIIALLFSLKRLNFFRRAILANDLTKKIQFSLLTISLFVMALHFVTDAAAQMTFPSRITRLKNIHTIPDPVVFVPLGKAIRAGGYQLVRIAQKPERIFAYKYAEHLFFGFVDLYRRGHIAQNISYFDIDIRKGRVSRKKMVSVDTFVALEHHAEFKAAVARELVFNILNAPIIFSGKELVNSESESLFDAMKLLSYLAPLLIVLGVFIFTRFLMRTDTINFFLFFVSFIAWLWLHMPKLFVMVSAVEQKDRVFVPFLMICSAVVGAFMLRVLFLSKSAPQNVNHEFRSGLSDCRWPLKRFLSQSMLQVTLFSFSGFFLLAMTYLWGIVFEAGKLAVPTKSIHLYFFHQFVIAVHSATFGIPFIAGFSLWRYSRSQNFILLSYRLNLAAQIKTLRRFILAVYAGLLFFCLLALLFSQFWLLEKATSSRFALDELRNNYTAKPIRKTEYPQVTPIFENGSFLSAELVDSNTNGDLWLRNAILYKNEASPRVYFSPDVRITAVGTRMQASTCLTCDGESPDSHININGVASSNPKSQITFKGLNLSNMTQESRIALQGTVAHLVVRDLFMNLWLNLFIGYAFLGFYMIIFWCKSMRGKNIMPVL